MARRKDPSWAYPPVKATRTCAPKPRKPSKQKTIGHVIYQGPSLFDGSPIVAIVTFALGNRKTRMCSLYIIPDIEAPPAVAVTTGTDQAVCGACRFRPVNGGGCYVVLIQGPNSVHSAHRRGRYAPEDPAIVGAMVARKGAGLRLGSWGDPAAVPAAILSSLVTPVRSAGYAVTGYTHTVTDPLLGFVPDPQLRRLVVASVHNGGEHADARADGWRTFLIIAPGDTLPRGTFACPASEEQGKRLTCSECGACDGARSDTDRRASAAIVVHGSQSTRAALAIRAGQPVAFTIE